MYKYLSIVFSLMVNLKNFIEKNSKNIQTVVSETKRPMLAPIYPSFGINKKDLKNAIIHAHKPNIDFLMEHFVNKDYDKMIEASEAVLDLIQKGTMVR